MKYYLIYHKNITLKGGDEIRLELHKAYPDDFPLYPITREIGDVLAGLRLDIEGGMDDIDAPILKTSLTFSLVDAPDHEDELSQGTGPKCGNWEEFYTSDATGWKVVLLGRKTYEGNLRTLWSGYVTPDSYTETLQYHGVVSITARDNIGHLQDFEFDARGNAEGMITPYDLITQAWAKIASPMVLEWRGVEDSIYWPQTGGVDAIYTYLNVSAFEGKSWYEAVSGTLYSLGLVMRYVGRNIVAVCPLRLMPAYTEEALDDLPQITPQFVAYGTRELVPAVKEITEEVSYELNEGVDIPIIEEADFPGTQITVNVNAENIFGEVSQKTIVVWPINNEGDTGWANIKSNTLFFNPHAYPNLLQALTPIDECMFLAVNTNDRMVWYGQNIVCRPLRLTLEYGPMIERFNGGIMASLNIHTVKSVKGAIKLTTGGTEYYYDGSQFTTTYKALTLSFEDGVIEKDIAFHKLSGQQGLLQFFIFSIDVEWPTGYPTTGDGAYIGLKPLNFAATEATSLMQKNVVRTVYNEGNNVRMSRTPALGPAYDEVAMAGLIPNGIFRKESGAYVPTTEWAWPYGIDTAPLQLAALVHKQLLMFHSKTNNLLSGTIVNADMLNPRTLWVWKDKTHMLLSGSYNFLNGQLEGATLREFVRYEDLWR